MAFEKPRVQPQFADLKAILSQTKLDETTYQLLQTLIERLTRYQSFVKEELDKKGTGPGPAGADSTVPGPPGAVGPPGPGLSPHQHTHQLNGNDTLLNNAWVNVHNIFTEDNQITKVNPVLHLKDTTPGINSRVFRFLNTLESLHIQAISDFGESTNGTVRIDRLANVFIDRNLTVGAIGGSLSVSGEASIGGAIHANGNTNLPAQGGFHITGGWPSPVSGRIIFGDNTGWQLHLSTRVGSVNYDRFTFYDNGQASLTGPVWINNAGGNVALKNSFNIFTEDQQIYRGSPTLYFKDSNQPTNSNVFRFLQASQVFYIQAINDVGSATSGTFMIDRNANITADGSIRANNGTFLGPGSPLGLSIGNTDINLFANSLGILDRANSTYYAIFGAGIHTFYRGLIMHGHVYPSVPSSGLYVGLDANPWQGFRSHTALVVTSDIRKKTIRGKLENVLDLVDEVDPIIASLDSDPRHEDFPTFSAQDIQEKIDARLGTHIVHVPDDPTLPLGMAYDKLAPVMWQMIKELKAKVEGK